MWLGNIASLPEKEQYYLLSENIESDHSIGSEFYDGQIECKFPDHSKEDSLFQCRSKFLEACFKKFNQKIAHLDEEVFNLALSLRRPIVDSDKERQHLANILHKIYIASFDNSSLGKILASRNITIDDNMKEIKRIEKIIENLSSKIDLRNLMCPFYVINDLRIAYLHLGSKDTNEGDLDFIKERLGLDAKAQLTQIYDAIIIRLTSSFKHLTEIVNSTSSTNID